MYGKPRIAVVDDDESVRQGLANLISSVLTDLLGGVTCCE